MILIFRQYLLSLTVPAAGLMWGVPTPELIAWCVVAAAIDTFLTGRSPELAFYCSGLDLDSPAPLGLSPKRALTMQMQAALASGLIPLSTYLLESNATVQRIANMSALLISGSVASYCGFRSMLHSQMTLRSILRSSDRIVVTGAWTLPFLALEALKQPAKRISIALVGLVVAAAMIGLCLLALGGFATVDVRPSTIFVALIWAPLFQFLVAGVAKVLFSLRWSRA